MSNEAKIGDVLARFEIMTEADALDFEKTGRAVLIVEDNAMGIPLPRGKQGEPGEPGEPGPKFSPDLFLREATDGEALSRLQRLSAGWREAGSANINYTALNEPTGSAFFYTRGGWHVYRDFMGGRSELIAGEYELPITLRNTEQPEPPTEGIRLFAEGDQLKAIKTDGTVSVIA